MYPFSPTPDSNHLKTMAEFHGPALDAHVPDDLTVAQFMLDYRHPLRPNQGATPCLIENATGRGVSLNELRDRTSGLAKSLSAKYKIGEKDVVLICSPNHIDYPVAIWATQYLGAIFTGANPANTPNELVYQLKITDATLIIAHSSSLQTATKAANLAGLSSDRVILLDANPGTNVPSVSMLVEEGIHGPRFVPRKLGPGEGKTKIATLCMSSGTTGQPKAVAISHTGMIANLIQLSFLNQDARQILRPGDISMAILPWFHAAGLAFNLHWLLFCGTSLVVIPKFVLTDMLESIARHRIQHLVLVPPIVVALCKNPDVKKYDLSSIKFIECGAAPMTSELQEQLKRVCPRATVGQAYGLTEVACILTMTPIARPFSCGSVGILLPGVTVRVVKHDGSLAGYNEPGELVVKTPSLALGYHKNATDEAFVDGWYRTGDEVKIDENGEVWITDRLKELIKVWGFQVSPAELEGFILNHPDVSDACVVGVPDKNSGEVPLAFVVLKEEAAERAKDKPELIQASIKKYVADNKVKYKHLTGGVEIISLIPKNASGKILRRVLREQVKERQAQLGRAKL
ncbi:phenylacetyl-CoA ligase [Mycena vulgaris]|nr:phenylacetyl-CoA ligase [Mycena vulgaris]